MTDRSAPPGIAVIGMACRMPTAPDLEAFWKLLEEGRQPLVHFDDAMLASAGVAEDVRARPDYVKAGHVLEDVDLFAAEFFGYSPSEAALLDPQHRLFLELAHGALEDGGYGAGRSQLKVGVFAGCATSTYFLDSLRADGKLDALHLRLANEKDYLSLRVGYKLDLRGPCVSIQTACSTSLVAVAAACESLRSRGTDMALAGGIAVAMPQGAGYQYQRGGLLSPDGCCRAFSDDAAGTAPGTGAGVVLLKRMDDAVRDGDHVYAVIRGSAVNNDGAAKVGFTAPGVEGQIAVIREAQAHAGIAPESVSYVECHGAGTALGDPVEISAMTQAFGATRRTGFCAIGSVKTNIGHLDCAAGIAGFIKTVLALHHRKIPASLHYQRPNRAIDFSRTPFFVNPALRAWDTESLPRRAGVSSFGLGGTNAHIVLEEATPSESAAPTREVHLLPLSARTPASLTAVFARLESHLRSHPHVCLADAAFTLACGRATYAHRRAVICRDVEDAVRKLAAGPGDGRAGGKEKPLLLLFPGHRVSPEAARALWEKERAFRESFVRAALALDAAGRDDLRRRAVEAQRWELLPQIPNAPFAAEYAMAALWKACGLFVNAVGGRGAGRFAAAATAGIFSLEEAARRACGLAGREAPQPAPGVRMLSASTGSWIDREDITREDTWSSADGRDEGSLRCSAQLEAKGWLVEECRLWPEGDRESGLGMLARLWESGCRVDWKTFHAGERRRRVPLPTYPLERTRYWLDSPAATAERSPSPPSQAAAASWFHAPVWKRMPAVRVEPGRRVWLVLSHGGDIGREVCLQLREAGHEVALAEWAAELQARHDGSYRLDCTNADHFRLLLNHLRGRVGLPNDCAHLGGLHPSFEHGIASLQAALQGFWSTSGARQMRIHAVGAGMVEVTGEESLHPERAMWMALCHTAALEQRDTSCHVIDAGAAPVSRAEAHALARRLVPVLLDRQPPPFTALRGKHRWVREWEPIVSAAATDTTSAVLRQRGVYLITGGLGGVGAAVARELVSSCRARLALVGRTPLPPADAWDRHLASAAPNDAVGERIRRVREIEAMGGEVLVLRADVSVPGDAERAVASAVERFGALHGIIHAAGLPGGSLVLRGRIDLERGAFPAKVEGTRALWQAARQCRPDFVVLMSSVLALSGFPGMADYCAANAFLDAFAATHDGVDGIRVVSIGWGMWRWNTWRLAPGARERLEQIRREWGFASEEGARALCRALEYRLPHIVVSKHAGFSASDWPTDAREAPAGAPRAARHPRPELDNPYVPPRDGLEADVAEVWQQMLGLEQVGRDDHFLDLGGNSLLALDLVARLRTRFGLDLHMNVIFTSPTVAALSRALVDAREHKGDEAALIAMEGVPR